jgi:hypothetical protein
MARGLEDWLRRTIGERIQKHGAWMMWGLSIDRLSQEVYPCLLTVIRNNTRAGK